MKWRPLLFKLHRDVGFLCFGLTIVYAVSGIAVNHRHHWDYNYSKNFEARVIGDPAALLGVEPTGKTPGDLAREQQDALVARIVDVVGREELPRKAFWRGADRLSLFFGQSNSDVVDYLPSEGKVEHTVKKKRFLIRQFNELHLNEIRTKWTYVGDAYAALLLFLGISGVIMVRGKRGLKGRGGILLALGVAVPLVVILLWGR